MTPKETQKAIFICCGADNLCQVLGLMMIQVPLIALWKAASMAMLDRDRLPTDPVPHLQ